MSLFLILVALCFASDTGVFSDLSLPEALGVGNILEKPVIEKFDAE